MNSYLTSRGLKSIWISERTDGRAGSGSATDPFNGGTPDRFDKLMVDVPEGWAINILGRHLTRGVTAKNGWRLVGHAGATLELVDATTELVKHFIIRADQRIGDLVICGLTLDAAAKATVKSVFSGIAVHVETLTVRNVTIVNSGTFGATGLECFGLFASATKHLHIDGLTLHSPKSDQDSNGGWKGVEIGDGNSGLIERVNIIGDVTQKCAGMGAANMDGYRFKDCRIQDCEQGFYNDSFGHGDLEVSDCVFLNCQAAIRVDYSGNASGLAKSFRVLRNRIVVRDAEHAHAMSWFGNASATPSFDTVIVRDNYITAPAGKGFIRITNARYFEAVGNFFDCDGPYLQMEDRVAVKVTSQDVWANYNRNGEII